MKDKHVKTKQMKACIFSQQVILRISKTAIISCFRSDPRQIHWHVSAPGQEARYIIESLFIMADTS